MKSIDPSTNLLIHDYQEFTAEKIDSVISYAQKAWKNWKNIPFANRAVMMKNAASLLRSKSEDYSRLMTLEMGKPIRESRAEVEKSTWVCEYYADNAEQMLAVETVQTDASESYITCEPIGIILGVMPWNFPFWQVFRFAAPALMAGNACLLKHSSNVSGCSLAIEKLFTDAGFPEDIFCSLLISSIEVERIIENPLIKAVTLTGSEPAGRSVAACAGRNLKKTVMELGGSDPLIILEDADIFEAAQTAVKARMINTGQSCIAAKRFIVVEKVADYFIKLVHEQIKKLKSGNPMDEETDIGPLARPDLADELVRQVNESVRLGAEQVHGFLKSRKMGNFIDPILLTNVKAGMPAFDEETFGPLMAVIIAKNEEHAIELANQSNFGLGASLWTKNPDKAKKLVPRIDAGAVFVNGLVKSDPRLPFGGIKNSGYGRELSHYGIKEFVNIKSVWMK